MHRLFLGALMALLVSAPAAHAAPVAPRDDLAATQVALAGGEVLVARERRDGRVELDAIALDGGARRIVLSVPSPSGLPGKAMLAASPQRVGMVVPMRARSGAEVEWRVYSGPPAGPLALVLRVPARGRTWMPVWLDVDGDRLLLAEWHRRERRLRSRTLEPGAGWVPLPWVRGGAAAVAIAGPYTAVLAGGQGSGSRVALHDRATGAEQAALPAGGADAPLPDDVDLAPSGQIVARLARGLSMAGPGVPPHALPVTGRLRHPRFSGAGLVAVDTAGDVDHPVLVAADGSLRPLGAPTGWVADLAADDRGVAWLANGCVRYAAVAAPPPAGPASDPCPTTEIGLVLNNESKLRGRDIRVPVLCISAPDGVCRGTVVIRHRGRIVGSGDFAIPAGRRPRVTARLNRLGLRLVRGRNPILRIGARMTAGRIGQSRGVTELSVVVPRRARGYDASGWLSRRWFPLGSRTAQSRTP